MTYQNFIQSFPKWEREDAKGRTIQLDATDSAHMMSKKMHDALADKQFGTFYVTVGKNNLLIDYMQVLEIGTLGSGKGLDVYPQENSTFPTMQNTDVETFAKQIEDAYGKSKHQSRIAQAEALCDGIKSGSDFEISL